jgi:hypothetical protein
LALLEEHGLKNASVLLVGAMDYVFGTVAGEKARHIRRNDPADNEMPFEVSLAVSTKPAHSKRRRKHRTQAPTCPNPIVKLWATGQPDRTKSAANEWRDGAPIRSG